MPAVPISQKLIFLTDEKEASQSNSESTRLQAFKTARNPAFPKALLIILIGEGGPGKESSRMKRLESSVGEKLVRSQAELVRPCSNCLPYSFIHSFIQIHNNGVGGGSTQDRKLEIGRTLSLTPHTTVLVAAGAL